MAGRFAMVPMEACLQWVSSRAITGQGFRVLLALVSHADVQGRAWPGAGRIAKLAAMNEADVRKQLAVLLEAAVIERAGQVATVNGNANVWRIVGFTPGTGTRPTPGADPLPTPGNIPGGTPGKVDGSPRVPAPPKHKDKQSEHIEQTRSRAVGWDSVLMKLKACGFKIDDPTGKPDAHKLIERMTDAEVCPQRAFNELRSIFARPASNDDLSIFFERQRNRARNCIDDLVSEASKLVTDAYYAKCPSNLVRSKIFELGLTRLYHADASDAADKLCAAVKNGKVSQAEALEAVAKARRMHNGGQIAALCAPLLLIEATAPAPARNSSIVIAAN